MKGHIKKHSAGIECKTRTREVVFKTVVGYCMVEAGI